MKKYDNAKSFTEFALKVLEKNAEVSPEKFVVDVTRTYNPEPTDELERILVCECWDKELGACIPKIEIEPLSRCPLPSNEKLSLKEIISALRKVNRLKIDIDVRFIKPLGDGKWLAELPNVQFVIEGEYVPREYTPGKREYQGYILRNDKRPFEVADIVIYTPENKKEALQLFV